jgi:hypothetical protein
MLDDCHWDMCADIGSCERDVERDCMNDRDFAIMIRRMLLAIVAKLEQRYKIGKYADAQPVEIGENDTLTINL